MDITELGFNLEEIRKTIKAYKGPFFSVFRSLGRGKEERQADLLQVCLLALILDTLNRIEIRFPDD